MNVRCGANGCGDDLIIVALSVGFGAAVVLLVGILGGRLPRNVLLGLRSRTLLASDEAWKAGHDAAAPGLRTTGVIGLASGVGTAITRTAPGLSMGFAWLGLATLVIGTLRGAVVAHRAVRAMPKT